MLSRVPIESQHLALAEGLRREDRYAPALDRGSASAIVSFSGIASLSPPFRSGSAQVSTVPRVGVGCRPPGAGSVLGSVTIIETVQLVRVAP